MNSKLLVNTEIRCDDVDVNDYIGLLEEVVLAYTEDNATRLLGEANRVIGILADDMSKIAEDGMIRNTKIIKEEKNNMMMDRIVMLLKQTDIITSVGKKSVAFGKGKIKEMLSPDEISPEEVERINKSYKGPPGPDDISDSEDDSDDFLNSDTPAIEQLIRQRQDKVSKTRAK